MPYTVPGNWRPSFSSTVSLLAPLTTWRLVRIQPATS